MKRVMKNVLLRYVSFLLITAFSLQVSAQNVSLKANTPIPGAISNGYVEYLPEGYTTDVTTRYPLVIFLGGIGHTGDGTASPSGLFKFFNHLSGSGSFYPHDWM